MFLPVGIDVKNKKCLIVGGGKTAYRKITVLSRYEAVIEVIAKEIKEEKIRELRNIKITEEEFNKKDLKEYMLVIAATDDKDLNSRIVEICKKNDILVNNVTSKEEMTLRFGAIYEDEDYQILISTHGKNCKKSKGIRDHIKKLLDKNK